jgi:60 kDa SS-A/Ro ribonucleoprotein
MARFKAPQVRKPGATRTTNVAGGPAYDRPPRVELAALMLTSMVQDTFYESADANLDRLVSLADRIAVEKGGLQFCAKAALYARHTGNLRSISHAMAGEVARLRYKHVEAGTWGPRFFEKIVFRLDDAAEIASYWLTRNAKSKPKTLPNAMKRGFRAVLSKAKPDLLAKWNGASTRTLTLRQLAHLVHPSGSKDSAIYKLRGGKLEAATTHEVVMTKAGQAGDAEAVAKAKAVGWAELFAKKKIKYMAALRGAKRILRDAPECVDALCEKLANVSDIEGSKVLPFQLMVARREIEQVSGQGAARVIEAIDKGTELSMANLPRLPGRTLVALDVSGSMTGSAGRSYFRGGAIPMLGRAVPFAIALLRASDYAELVTWSDANHPVALVRLDKNASFDTNGRLIWSSPSLNGGTNMDLVFATQTEKWDRIVILTDEQSWMNHSPAASALADYEKRTGCKPMVYCWDIAGSATCQFPQSRVVTIAGISARAMDLISAVEQDPDALVKAIEAVEL